ncbi:MAG: hypothetical protein HYY25_16145 [Candidatus Wallbacteria bacterium]|nr:hypothetical protein [Candidatus Wallbacteria bacterium]
MRPSRRGVLLPAAIVVLAILLLLASSRLLVSRQQFDTVVRLADHERAYQVAASAVALGQRQVGELLEFLNDPDPATRPKRERAPPGLRDLVELVVDDLGGLKAGLDCPLEPALMAHLRALPDVESLELSLASAAPRPLYEGGPAGLVPDSRELSHLLSLSAVAVVGRSRTRVVAFKEARVVNVLPPVLGKFSLFLRGQRREDREGCRDSARPQGVECLPAQVLSGDALAQASGPADVALALDGRGWVYLGGGEPWELGLAAGGGLAGHAAAGLAAGEHEYELEPGSPLAARGDLAYYARAEPMAGELGGTETKEALAGRPAALYGRSATLNLHGSRELPSPSVICGRVVRRWALVQGLVNRATATRAPLPWLDEATFAQDRWPGGARASTVAAIREQFGGQHARYATRMSDLVVEPYNAGNAFLMGLGAAAAGPVMAPAIPVLSSDRLAVDGRPADLLGTVAGAAWTLEDESGKELARDLDLQAFQDLEFLDRKAARSYESAAELLRECVRPGSARLALPGVVRVAGNLALTRPLEVPRGGGGLLLVDGDIRLAAELSVETNEPLTLVSLRGSVRVETAATISAGLVALAGQVTLPESFDVRGPVAAGTLEVARTARDVRRRIAWNPRFDPTSVAAREAAYRVVAPGRWRFYVP